MNFEHLDDAMPVEPDSTARAAVGRRARRLRQRRAIVPGAALLAVAGAAIVAITMLSNEGGVPSRVVAGPTTTTTVVAQPTGAAVTRDGVTVTAGIPADTVTTGTQVPVTITAAHLDDVLRPPLPMRVCIVDPPYGKGWTGFDPGASCSVHEIARRSTQVIELTAPDVPGEYAVFLRWSPAPSGDFLPFTLHVVEHVSAETSSTMVTVPNVVGMTADAATQRLQAVGLGVQTRVGLVLDPNDQPPGVVVRMEPDAASRVTQVPRGTTITLTVSPGTATTPDTLQVAPSAP